jgi:hypothetical protein
MHWFVLYAFFGGCVSASTFASVAYWSLMSIKNDQEEFVVKSYVSPAVKKTKK